ncbi:hypothetical protein K493DRAFT_310326 [Basidiobolus meristosporus CBS 931.73]|uniref:C3H1-type domain-containing protein n=1 Tax=Basidiobolus meristosporus CBS 931.73 TaxID=1314790 RepID=A0A1Y1Z9Y0_9FUNG|nr:hypothetical protein K493DRAFT_310326 [Basidiobolus meristosporus CBS 931.73]|eukprot:ORY07080.1 hypothetical protein K493DRAFT_310326 [Basidiobolus meristosporus CBS 931.73]
MNEPTLCYVAGAGDLERLQEELSRATCNLEVVDSQGLTALMIAAKENQLECVRVLILAGADPNAYNEKGTASEFTAHPEILQLLTDAKNSVLSRGYSQATSPSTPITGSPTACRFFMKGYCRFGNKCRFAHLGLDYGQPEPIMSRPTCRYWLQGNCRFGHQCRYEHPVTAGHGIHAQLPYPLPVAYVAMSPPVGMEDTPYQDHNTSHFMYDNEIEERIENFGFTEEEVGTLLSYGVMPWENNAWEILEAIHN